MLIKWKCLYSLLSSINIITHPLHSFTVHTLDVNTSRLLWWTAVSSKISWLYPDPGPSCRFTHSSFANFTVFEYFYKVMSPTHFSPQFPSSHIENTSNNAASLLSPSNSNCGKFACKDLGIRNISTTLPLQRISHFGLKHIMHKSDSYSIITTNYSLRG